MQTVTIKYLQKTKFLASEYSNAVVVNQDGDLLWLDYHKEFGDDDNGRSFVLKTNTDLSAKDSCYDLTDSADHALVVSDVTLTEDTDPLNDHPLVQMDESLLTVPDQGGTLAIKDLT